MNSENKAFALAVIAVSIAVIMVITFAWFGPGLGASVPPASAALFDEELVQQVYQRVSPAVVDVNVDRQAGDVYHPMGFGSGFVIDSDGHVVTNNHVVQRADRVRISFQDGASVPAEILGSNPANDLALLKVPAEAVSDIDPVPFGDSARVFPGQLAIAIGSPFGMDGSVTVGVISGTGRTLDSEISRPISGVLQTDALISPGNSGGPLLNRQGEVVGINTAIQISAAELFSSRLTRRSIGFAVPINTLDRMMPDLKAGKIVRPPWLGISAISLDAGVQDSLGLELDYDKGVYVTQVAPGSPAEAAGLVPSGVLRRGQPAGGGDLLLALEGARVETVGDLIARLNDFLPGDTVELELVRDGREMTVEVTLGEWPSYFSQSHRRWFLPSPEGENAPQIPRAP